MTIAIRRMLESSRTLAGTGVFARFWVVSSRGGGSSNVLFKELTLLVLDAKRSITVNVLDADDDKVSRDARTVASTQRWPEPAVAGNF